MITPNVFLSKTKIGQSINVFLTIPFLKYKFKQSYIVQKEEEAVFFVDQMSL